MTVIFLKDFSNLHGEATFEYSICVVFQTDAAKLGEKILSIICCCLAMTYR